MSRPPEPTAALTAWNLSAATTRPMTGGHINHTFLVDAQDGRRLVLQRLSPIFGAEVNLDIDAITAQLERAGLTTPRLLPTAAGDLWHTDREGHVWRLMTYIPGHTVERADSADRCRQAGALLGRFHRALWSCDHVFAHRRPGVHDTPRHLAALGQALEDHKAHPSFGEVAPVAHRILAAADRRSFPADLQSRVAHGDPKITNVIFDEHAAAVCLVDLDTVARMPLPLELGDALRSWCCPLGEEVEGPPEIDYFEAALAGYAGAVGTLPTDRERRAIPAATQLIAVELAARFCADALAETYFGWDPARYESAAAHNLARARSQIFLAEALDGQMARLQAITAAAWAA